MITGIGIDLVSVSRLKEKLKNDAFQAKIFSEGERAYCNSSANKEQHYAARFAAKEAFLKAIGKGLNAGYELNLIEVVHDSSGRPHIVLNGTFKELMSKEGWAAVNVSLSHEGDFATAIVIIEK